MLAVCFALAAALGEPGLIETQQAASRAAAGTPAEDATRTARARNAHWAPQLRGQAGLRDDERSRNGEFRLAPLREQDLGVAHTWAVMLTWDFSQVVFAREESQLALAHAHLSRLRREGAERAGQLWLERRQAIAAAKPCAEVLALTAALDAVTAGLFRESLAREEAACAPRAAGENK